MNDWVTHQTHDEPKDLAPDQIIETTWPKNFKPELKGDNKTQYISVFRLIWLPGIEYRVVKDKDGIGYCNHEGLKQSTQYVATQQCVIGGERALQFSSKPEYVKPSLIAPYKWDNGENNGRVDAPQNKIKPGDCKDSILRVWWSEEV
ncbi:hypothetical protein PBI_SCTP2_336 [Salicola phage SCTP-2]|nr:hypothetical protein PBI_SCTP2_336 [Salicola phage SCTP-2]